MAKQTIADQIPVTILPGELRKLKAESRKLKAESRKYKKQLRDLSAAVSGFLRQLDQAMHGPSTLERGKKIAALCNALDMENDRARYFALGVDYRKDKKRADPPAGGGETP